MEKVYRNCFLVCEVKEVWFIETLLFDRPNLAQTKL